MNGKMDKRKYNQFKPGDVITYNTICYDVSNLLKWNFLFILKKINETKKYKRCTYMVLISNQIRFWTFYGYKNYFILK